MPPRYNLSLSDPLAEGRSFSERVHEAAEFWSMDEEYDVIFSMIQSGTRKAGHPLVARAAFAGCFVASMDRSYSNGWLSSGSLDASNDDHGRWAGAGGPPD
jgi:hypothetical protein